MMEGKNLILRKMEKNDLPALTFLERVCFSDPWSEGILAELPDSSFDEIWVLESDGTIVAYANFRFLAGEGELMRIAVLPEFRGKGLSRKLMDRLAESSAKKNAPDLTLEVRAGNTVAINLYQAYGFKAEAVRKGYYHNPTEDAVIMWRRPLLGITT
jgi:ribosomal-protein-alanine N-acetyltransferase